MANGCTSHNFGLFAIFLPKIIRVGAWWKFDEVMTKIILLSFFDTRYRLHNECQLSRHRNASLLPSTALTSDHDSTS